MSARKPKITTVKVGGVRRTVVDTATTHWIERREDGALIAHAGRLLGGQIPGRWLAEAKKCSRCKEPTWFATPRGRGVHPSCEGWLDVVPDDVFRSIRYAVAADLAAHIIDDPIKETPRERHVRAA